MNKETKHTNPFDFIRLLAHIKLSKEARVRMRVALSAYADMHVLPAHVPQKMFSGNLFWMFKNRSTYAGLAALVLVVATGTQATLASEKTIPGDILYSVKVSVAEPVALALTAPGEEKAELATKFASRRVNEASTLSAQGKLDEKTAIKLAASFDTHVDVISKEAATLEANGDVAEALEVRTDIEKDLSESAAAFTIAHTEEPSSDVETTNAFTAHIAAKTMLLAIEREELASALGVQVASTTAIGTINGEDIATLSSDSTSTLTLPEDTETPVTASSTASTTVETSVAEEAPAERIFKTFFFRKSGTDQRYPN